MYTTGKYVSRRTMLRGMGTAIGLPLLDSMTPVIAAAAKTAGPVRFLVTYMPIGTTMKVRPTEGTGRDYQLSRIEKSV